MWLLCDKMQEHIRNTGGIMSDHFHYIAVSTTNISTVGTVLWEDLDLSLHSNLCHQMLTHSNINHKVQKYSWVYCVCTCMSMEYVAWGVKSFLNSFFFSHIPFCRGDLSSICARVCVFLTTGGLSNQVIHTVFGWMCHRWWGTSVCERDGKIDSWKPHWCTDAALSPMILSVHPRTDCCLALAGVEWLMKASRKRESAGWWSDALILPVFNYTEQRWWPQ